MVEEDGVEEDEEGLDRLRSRHRRQDTVEEGLEAELDAEEKGEEEEEEEEEEEQGNETRRRLGLLEESAEALEVEPRAPDVNVE